jgi:hypothetical protein
MDPAARDAKLAHKAMKKKGDRHVWVLIEVACASSPDHLVAVRKAYCAAYSASLEEDVAACPLYKDPLKQFLVRLVTSYRYSGELVDDELARAEAAALHDAVVAGKDPLRGDVVRIVGSRSKPQLKATFERFRQEHGKAIDDVLEERRSDQLAAVLKTAVWCLVSPEKHFAEVKIHTFFTGNLLKRYVTPGSEIHTTTKKIPGDPKLHCWARHRRGVADEGHRLACGGRHAEGEGGIQGDVPPQDGDQRRQR